ncbi:MAG: hypothetical protein ABIR92_04950 [Gemmatimonadaceae bacterium]
MTPLLMTAGACVAIWLAIQVEMLDLVPETAQMLPEPEMQPAE